MQGLRQFWSLKCWDPHQSSIFQVKYSWIHVKIMEYPSFSPVNFMNFTQPQCLGWLFLPTKLGGLGGISCRCQYTFVANSPQNPYCVTVCYTILTFFVVQPSQWRLPLIPSIKETSPSQFSQPKGAKHKKTAQNTVTETIRNEATNLVVSHRLASPNLQTSVGRQNYLWGYGVIAQKIGLLLLESW